jgi:hypothetical protein
LWYLGAGSSIVVATFAGWIPAEDNVLSSSPSWHLRAGSMQQGAGQGESKLLQNGFCQYRERETETMGDDVTIKERTSTIVVV